MNILDSKTSFNRLDFYTPYDLFNEMNKCNYMKYEVNTNEEYDFYSEEEERLSNDLEKQLGCFSYKTRQAFELKMYSVFKPENNLHDLLSYVYNNLPEESFKEISKWLCLNGIDGYIIDNVYVIVNKDKLNQNIVRDKETLFGSVLNNLQESVDNSHVNNNDNISDKLINCSIADIDFREEEYNIKGVNLPRSMYVMHVLVNGEEVPTELVYFRAEQTDMLYLSPNQVGEGEYFFQIHINVDETLRRKGIAYKLYQAFVRIFGSCCSLFKNRASSFYYDNNSSIKSDSAINNLWKKLSASPNIKVFDLFNKQGKHVGVAAKNTNII